MLSHQRECWTIWLLLFILVETSLNKEAYHTSGIPFVNKQIVIFNFTAWQIPLANASNPCQTQFVED